MPVVEMKRVSLLAPKKEKNALLSALAETGCVEVRQGKVRENTRPYRTFEAARENVEEEFKRAEGALSVLKDIQKEAKKEKGEKLDFPFDPALLNERVEYDVLRQTLERKNALFEKIGALEEIARELGKWEQEIVLAREEREEYLPYLSFDLPFRLLVDSRRTSVRYGLVSAAKWTNGTEKFPEGVEVFAGESAGTNRAVIVVFLKEDTEEVERALARCDFRAACFDTPYTARGAIAETEARERRAKERKRALIESAREFLDDQREFKLLADALEVELEKERGLELTTATRSVFLAEGYCPADCTSGVEARIRAVSQDAFLSFDDPEEGEDVPALTRENPVVLPFANNITAMFGAPRYGETDPNPFVAFFYFLFFGFMLGDAGYGILLILAGFAFLLAKKPVRKGSMIAMFAICGFSTLFWGAIFGSWFAISEETMMGNAFGRFLMSMKLIDPLSGSETLIMFGLALALGAVQISVGYAINGTAKMRKKPLDGLLNDYSWVLIFIGIGLYLIYALLKVEGLNIAGLVVAILGLAMLLAGGALGKKNPLSMIVGAFKNLYGGINVFSDLLSYARLFGLGLTTGVIGLVVNEIGMIFVDMIPGVGYLFAVVVWIGGHAFNFAINLLGVYVHNSRLQFVEFFGKFYEGSGSYFKPLGSGTKYALVASGVTPPKKGAAGQNRDTGAEKPSVAR